VQAPTIIGPDQYDRNNLPLEFHIGATWNKYVAVELAADWQLFDAINHGANRTAANWFASWTQGLIEILGDTTYTVPLDAWQRLRTAPYLYYRVLTSADKGAWTNFQTSTTDGDASNAPRVRSRHRRSSTAPPRLGGPPSRRGRFGCRNQASRPARCEVGSGPKG
jgi:hypothetical protein